MTEETRNEKIIRKGARKVTAQDFQKVLDKSGEIATKFRVPGPLQRFVEDGRLFLSIVRDYWSGRYRQVPYAMIAAVVFVLLYVFNPFDLMPDFLPIIGEIDDAAIVTAAMLILERDLIKYRDWKLAQIPVLAREEHPDASRPAPPEEKPS